MSTVITTLRDEVKARIERGIIAPSEIADSIIEEVDEMALALLLVPHAHQFVYAYAHQMHRVDRAAARNAPEPSEKSEAGTLVPGYGWVPLKSLDADMCDALSAHYRYFAKTYRALSSAYADYARRLRESGGVLGDLLSDEQIEQIGAVSR